jgi:hypothetical protein
MKTALRDRSFATMYRPGKTAALVADLSLGLAMILVGLGCIGYALMTA